MRSAKALTGSGEGIDPFREGIAGFRQRDRCVPGKGSMRPRGGIDAAIAAALHARAPVIGVLAAAMPRIYVDLETAIDPRLIGGCHDISHEIRTLGSFR